MGVMLQFPTVYRDLTSQFLEWKQQTFRSLTPEMKQVILTHETDFNDKTEENRHMPIEIFNAADRVHTNIWIGSADCAEDKAFLGSNGINVILNMAAECTYSNAYRHVRVVRIGIDDAKLTNVGIFEKAADVIKDAVRNEENILVHCAAGVSRSATAVIAYLMLYKGLGWHEALEVLRESRPCVSPHPLLCRALIRDFGDRFIP